MSLADTTAHCLERLICKTLTQADCIPVPAAYQCIPDTLHGER